MFEQNVTYGPGTGTFTSHTFEILIMLLGAALLGLWLGWILWGRYRQAADKLRLDNVSLTESVNAIRTELDNMKVRLATAENEKNNLSRHFDEVNSQNSELRSEIVSLENTVYSLSERNRQLETELGLASGPDHTDASVPFEIDTPQFESAVDDLAALETEEAAETSEATSYIHESPETHELSVEAPLIAPEFELAATPDEMPPVVPVLADARDDLKIVEGIGPKIEELLYKNGISTYSALASTPVEKIKEILISAGPRYAMHDPGTWSAQALLAANGEWENLQAYQDFLNAGKRPNP